MSQAQPARTRGDVDLNIRSGPQMSEYRSIYARIVRDRPGRVLDWGCGHGHAANALMEDGLDVVALEYSPAAEEGERRRLPLYPAVEAIFTPEAVRLPFDDGSFDAVLSLGVLEHVRDPHASLGEIRRILRPGGLLYVFKLPNRYSYLEWVARRMGLSYHGRLPDDTIWTVHSAREALEQHGLVVLEARRANMLPLTLPGRLATLMTPTLWWVNRALARVPILNLLATNVEAVARRP
jgi:SAM-dependent methyltransferase